MMRIRERVATEHYTIPVSHEHRGDSFILQSILTSIEAFFNTFRVLVKHGRAWSMVSVLLSNKTFPPILCNGFW